MAETKITCPECGKVLRPAKPIPAGKRVKCPQCSAMFVPAEEDDASAAVSKSPAKSAARAKTAAQAKPTAKKAADDKPPKAKSVPKPNDDDDEDNVGSSSYEFIDDHRKDDEPEIDYVPDTTIKDLRGPAQAAIMRPSNWIIRSGVVGFISYFAIMVIFTVPIIFPVPKPTNADGSPVVEKKDDKDKDKDKGSMFMIFGWDLMDVTDYPAWVIMLLVLGCICGITYCAIVTYGGVQMQTMNSRAWGMVASILVMLPVHTLGFYGLISIAFTFVWNLLFSADDIYWVMPVHTLAAFGTNLGIGIWGLVTLLSPDVIEGYEYVPEDQRSKKRDRD
jgi:hypothetical protein